MRTRVFKVEANLVATFYMPENGADSFVNSESVKVAFEEFLDKHFLEKASKEFGYAHIGDNHPEYTLICIAKENVDAYEDSSSDE